MHPTWMLTMLLGLLAAFCWSANRRFQLLKIGQDVERTDELIERLKGTYLYAFVQKKMDHYKAAGTAHKVIFVGFMVLLANTLMLWGRGFDPEFNLWVLGPEPVDLPVVGPVALGAYYEFIKDIVATLVLAGSLYFLYLRVFVGEKRMTHSLEAVIILFIIITMMVGDFAYVGASHVLYAKHWASACAGGQEELCGNIATIASHLGAMPVETAAELSWHVYPAPMGSLFSLIFENAGVEQLVAFAHVGFWFHATLVMVFLNLLPHSKHFHVITAIPNVFTRSLEPAGKLSFIGRSESLMETVDAAFTDPDNAKPVGVARLEDFTWKAILDFYTCTECGRCSDNCPAHRTGKILSPKQFIIDLRDHLYEREHEFLNRPGGPEGLGPDDHAHHADKHDDEAVASDDAHDHDHGDDHHHAPVYPNNPSPVEEVHSEPIDLVGNVIHPDVLWACTTCRACEEMCPVMISYVDKIVDMRRNLVTIKGEFPAELQPAFQGIEVNGNPWDLSRMDRANWAEGLDVPMMTDHPEAPVLFWVGCAASYDDRAKKIARATAKLLKAAGVDFAILGQQESCTGDPARRAGNEFLFTMMAEQNVATLNGYKQQGGIKTIVTSCPHCLNTLANEYPDFDGHYKVVHHSDYLLGLVAENKLFPRQRVEGRLVFHDSCYLGRYNDVYEQPRDILKSIPGVELVEVEEASRQKGLCCGAGGMQMFMEEQNRDRMNVRRTLQLLDTGAKTIATACPFCTTMITDGLKDQNKDAEIRQLDVAELLEESCALDRPIGVRAAMPQDPPMRSPAAGTVADPAE